MISALMKAADLAATLSSRRLSIEIKVTREGITIDGWYRAADMIPREHREFSIPWELIDQRAETLPFAVQQIYDELLKCWGAEKNVEVD